MAKRPRDRTTPRAGQLAETADKTLRSYAVGAVPILNHLLERMKLAEILQRHLPPEDGRTKVPTATGLLLLLRNVLISREPIYGVADWACGYAPDLLGLTESQLAALNDDRLGRCLGSLFATIGPELLLDVVRHAVGEFGLRLDELHNDSTSISFYGKYPDAKTEGTRRGRATQAITWGFSKDHRPDLKQLLYILTVTDDGGVPVYFTTASGNVSDDQTHRDTWDLLCQLVGGPDFLTRKAELDRAARVQRTERTLAELAALRERLEGPRPRFRDRVQVEQAVAEILATRDVERWLRVRVLDEETALYRQATPGRPGKETRYVRETRRRFALSAEVEAASLERETVADGLFPLLTNQRQMDAEEVLRAYKRQPLIEKRFSQFKSDFAVAPVYLKDVSRIQGLLGVYFLALLVQTLLEREVRQAMQRAGVEHLPLYGEQRDCRHPTARKLFDAFEPVQRHVLTLPGGREELLLTQLSPLQRQILKLLGIPAATYGR